MKLNISKFTARFKKGFDKDPYTFEPKPHLAWATMLLMFFVALIISGIISYFIYRSLNNNAITEQERIIPTSQTLNLLELQNLIKLYDGKKIEFSRYLSEPETIADPSL